MKRIKRVTTYGIIITILFCLGIIKANACVNSIAISGSTRRVNGHQTQWFNNGSVNYSGSVPSTSCFNISGGGDVVTVKTDGKIFQFQPKKIGTATVTVSVNSSCLCSGVSPISRSVYFILSEWGLKSLSIDNYSISPTFYNATFTYTANVPYETTSVNVKATANQSNSTLKGTGTHSLNVGKNTITVNVKTPQGDSRDYTVIVNRSSMVSAQSIKINGGDLELRVNDEKQLSYTINPTDANVEGLTWTSSNPNVVSVTNEGKIRTLSAGTAKIKLQLNNLTSEINVTVTKGVTSISCSSAMILNKNNRYQLEYEVLPKDATNKKVSFSVNNKLISIDEDGIITVGDKTGTSILTITSLDSGIKKDVTILISSDLESITFKQNVITMLKGDQITLNPIFKPSDVVLEADELTWASEDSSVASVVNGTVTGEKEGQTTISGEFKGVSGEVIVYVFEKEIPKVTEISAPEELTLMINGKTKLEYDVLPEDTPIKDVTFKANNDIVSIDENGLITAGGKAGNSTITIYSYDGSVKTTVKVKVIDEIKVTDIDLPKEIKLHKGEKYQIESTVFPDDATNKTLKYSTDSNLLTVSETGVITAGDTIGTATISVSSYDGAIVRNITVEIANKIEKLAFEKSAYEMKIGDKTRLRIIPTPDNEKIEYKNLVWSISDESVVEITYDGIVTAKKGGYVTVKVSLDNVTTSTSITVAESNASAGKIILVILICISVPVLVVVADYFRRKKLKRN